MPTEEAEEPGTTRWGAGGVCGEPGGERIMDLGAAR